MILFKSQELEKPCPCPYLPDKKKQLKYFLAGELNKSDVSFLLAKGWRKFGIYFFQPSCPDCRECIPIRILSNEFKPTKSQKRNLKKNSAIKVVFGPLKFSERAFEIYKDHSSKRFSEECNLEEFIFNFYSPSTPSLQSEFYLNDELIGLGYLDEGKDCLNSVYFIYDAKVSHLGLGIFSILKEIEYTRSLGLKYYCLGYYVQACQSMAYKGNFKPREHYNWLHDRWEIT
ncbi:MAG: arginyltransferase [Candidatus Scalinduaceae bacterium]